MVRSLLVGVTILTITASGVAFSQDWPGWRGPSRDGAVVAFEAPKAWPESLERGWQVEVGTGHSTPALVAGRLYVHARQKDEEVILALDAETGKELWRDSYPAPYEMDPTARDHGKGPRSSVTFADGRVFTLGVNGVLSCLDAEDGKVVWRHDFKTDFKAPPRYGASMSPLLVDGLCIAHVGTDGKGAIRAFDAATGKVRWSWDGDGPGYASPVVATLAGKRQVVTQTQFHAVGLSLEDGKELWKLEYKTTSDQNSVTPVVVADCVILSGYHKGTAAYAVDKEQPQAAWSTSKISMYMSSPVLRGDRVIGFSEKRRGQFFALDGKTGETIWTGDGREGENASLVLAGDVVLALNEASELVVFKADSEDYEELARYEVADSPTWAHLIVSGRTLS